jgi:transcription antitermination factor NusG
MSTAEYLARAGDMIRLRSGPYAGASGTVVSVHPDKNYPAANSLVMVKLMNGRINSCYMSNLEKLPTSVANS